MLRIKFLTIVILLSSLTFAQVNYDGPASGVVDTGVVITTDEFFTEAAIRNAPLRLIQHQKPEPIPTPISQLMAAPPEGSNFIIDPNYNKINSVDDSVIVFKDFEGYRQQNQIPPDPYLAVGPEHIILVVNSRFMITDKDGNQLKSIEADQWYSKLISNPSTFDPKIIYDKYIQRWVMVWLHINEAASESYYLFSVSDDSNPLGDWYNWALPSNVNGNSPNGSWGDYEGVGFDDKAIYLTSNQFYFSGGFSDTKLRIIPSSQFKNTAGPLEYTDIWNVKYPGTTANAFGLRPVRMETTDSVYYFVAHSPFTVGTNFGVYKLSSPITNPVLSGNTVTVTGYSQPPDVDQLGGGNPKIDGGGFGLRNEPVFKDGILHLVHSVRVMNNGAYSGVRYAAIDVNSNTAITDFVMGAPQKYHSYPAVAVDSKENVFITFSRSSKSEYVGAYFTILPATAQAPTGSFAIKEGNGNYVVTYGGTRNRWGDYNGAWLDPMDSTSVWFFTEYAHHKDTWGTWAAGVRFEPFENAYIFPEKRSIDFGELEVGTDTLTEILRIRNFGSQPLNISSVSLGRGDVFQTGLSKSLPVTLNAFDTLAISISFIPDHAEHITDSLQIISDDPDDPNIYIPISGFAYEINSAQQNVFYASTAPLNVSGKLFTISENDGSATEVGELGFPGVINLTINPVNKNIYGLIKGLDYSKLLVINALAGDAHLIARYDIPFNAITYDNDGNLYGLTGDKNIYLLNEDGTETHLSSLTKIPTSAAVNPIDNQMWFFSRTGLKSGKLYKVNPYTGEETEITAVDLYASDLTFDASGDLYALYDSDGKIAAIDTASGQKYYIGKSRVIRLSGLAINGDVIYTSTEREKSDVPITFELMQNYPNPFNPTTVIKYSIPEMRNAQISTPNVKLTVYDVLGREVATLVNEKQTAGNYEVSFNAKELSSGVYLYKLTAGSFVKTKKMMLMK